MRLPNALYVPLLILALTGPTLAKDTIANTMPAETLPTTNFAILGSMPDGDIEALAFIVMMEAAKSAQEDLKAIMAGVKAINKAKAQRAQIAVLVHTVLTDPADNSAPGDQSLKNRLVSAGLDRISARYRALFQLISGHRPPGDLAGAFVGFLQHWADHRDGPSDDAVALEVKHLLDGIPKPDRRDALAALLAWASSLENGLTGLSQQPDLGLQQMLDRRSKLAGLLDSIFKGLAEADDIVAGNTTLVPICPPGNNNERIVYVTIPAQSNQGP